MTQAGIEPATFRFVVQHTIEPILNENLSTPVFRKAPHRRWVRSIRRFERMCHPATQSRMPEDQEPLLHRSENTKTQHTFGSVSIINKAGSVRVTHH
jgi:hypothetical protein